MMNNIFNKKTMQINLKNKKYSVKFIASIIWAAFLIFFWNDTLILLADNYQFFHLQKTPFLINIIAYGFWILIFLVPTIFRTLLFNTLFIAFSYNKVFWLRQSASGLLINGAYRGFWFLLIPLFIMSMIFYSGSKHEWTILEGLTPMFADTQPLSVSKMDIVMLNPIYQFIIIIPFALAMILPKLFLMLITFALEFPVMSSLIILTSMLYSFWQREEARKWYQNLDKKNSDDELVTLTDKEIENLGGIDKVKKDLEKSRQIPVPHKE